MARPRAGESPRNVGVLEDAMFLAEQGLRDEAIMRRQGYTKRDSWMRMLIRGGLPTVGHKSGVRAPDLRERLFNYEPDPTPELVHGVHIVLYQRDGCRCFRCRVLNADRAREGRRRAMKRGPDPDAVHGRSHTYAYYGCRCELCTAANAAASKRYRDNHKGER